MLSRLSTLKVNLDIFFDDSDLGGGGGKGSGGDGDSGVRKIWRPLEAATDVLTVIIEVT